MVKGIAAWMGILVVLFLILGELIVPEMAFYLLTMFTVINAVTVFLLVTAFLFLGGTLWLLR